MTKRYEKFEEWMIGERVHWEGSSHYEPDSGVVQGRYYGDRNRLNVYWDATKLLQWVDVGDVTFEKDDKVEEQNTEQEIKWEIGQVVWDTSYGRGAVFAVFQETKHTGGQLQVVFDSSTGFKVWYNLDGSYKLGVIENGRTLFFSEPKIEAELFPPKKPFVPTLNKGDVIAYRQRGTSFTQVGIVEYEDEDSIVIEEDVAVAMRKHAFEFYKLGKEIKFEEN